MTNIVPFQLDEIIFYHKRDYLSKCSSKHRCRYASIECKIIADGGKSDIIEVFSK